MKAATLMLSLLCIGASASPQNKISKVTIGDMTWEGLENTLVPMDHKNRQCNCQICLKPGETCQPYKCQCVGNYGCYKCKTSAYVCQKGPGSGECS